MNNQLLAKLKKRQQASGIIVENNPIKTNDQPAPQKKVESKQSHSQFEANRNKVKALFQQMHGGNKKAQEEAQIVQKQQIKGNSESFANARKLLEQQGIGKAASSGIPNLPPPPALGELPPLPSGLPNLPPPPPPPPSLDCLPSLPLPPPPSLGGLLPPPPHQNANLSSDLPPPPSLPTLLPPSITSPLNLPPPPPLNFFPSPPIKQQKSSSPKIPKLPELPILGKNEVISQIPMPIKIQESQKKTEVKDLKQKKNKQQIDTIQQQAKIFEIKQAQTKKATAKLAKQTQKKSKKSISTEFFGKDLAGFIKRQFIRQTDILGTIGSKVEKKLYNFNFPSIENHLRDIQPIQALYADGSNLDVVSCYMQKNIDAAKKHNAPRQQFLKTFENYNWTADTKRYKTIRDSADCVPKDFKYRQLNFVQIKNALNRCDNLIKSFVKSQNYEGCSEIKKIKEQLDKLIIAYSKNPDSNDEIYDEIEKKVHRIKQTRI